MAHKLTWLGERHDQEGVASTAMMLLLASLLLLFHHGFSEIPQSEEADLNIDDKTFRELEGFHTFAMSVLHEERNAERDRLIKLMEKDEENLEPSEIYNSYRRLADLYRVYQKEGKDVAELKKDDLPLRVRALLLLDYGINEESSSTLNEDHVFDKLKEILTSDLPLSWLPQNVSEESAEAREFVMSKFLDSFAQKLREQRRNPETFPINKLDYVIPSEIRAKLIEDPGFSPEVYHLLNYDGAFNESVAKTLKKIQDQRADIEVVDLNKESEEMLRRRAMPKWKPKGKTDALIPESRSVGQDEVTEMFKERLSKLREEQNALEEKKNELPKAKRPEIRVKRDVDPTLRSKRDLNLKVRARRHEISKHRGFIVEEKVHQENATALGDIEETPLHNEEAHKIVPRSAQTEIFGHIIKKREAKIDEKSQGLKSLKKDPREILVSPEYQQAQEQFYGKEERLIKQIINELSLSEDDVVDIDNDPKEKMETLLDVKTLYNLDDPVDFPAKPSEKELDEEMLRKELLQDYYDKVDAKLRIEFTARQQQKRLKYLEEQWQLIREKKKTMKVEEILKSPDVVTLVYRNATSQNSNRSTAKSLPNNPHINQENIGKSDGQEASENLTTSTANSDVPSTPKSQQIMANPDDISINGDLVDGSIADSKIEGSADMPLSSIPIADTHEIKENMNDNLEGNKLDLAASIDDSISNLIDDDAEETNWPMNTEEKAEEEPEKKEEDKEIEKKVEEVKEELIQKTEDAESPSKVKGVAVDITQPLAESSTAAAAVTESSTVVTESSTVITEDESNACFPKLDIVFVLDTSGSLERAYREHVHWAVALVNSLPLEPDTIRIAAVQYARFPLTEFALGTYPTANDIREHLSQMNATTGVANTGYALRKAENELFRPDRARNNAAKVIVLFTDGKSADDPTKPAKQLREHKNVRIYVASAVEPASEMMLEKIAGKEENVFGPTKLRNLRDTLIVEAERTRACIRIGGPRSEYKHKPLRPVLQSSPTATVTAPLVNHENKIEVLDTNSIKDHKDDNEIQNLGELAEASAPFQDSVPLIPMGVTGIPTESTSSPSTSPTTTPCRLEETSCEDAFEAKTVFMTTKPLIRTTPSSREQKLIEKVVKTKLPLPEEKKEKLEINHRPIPTRKQTITTAKSSVITTQTTKIPVTFSTRKLTPTGRFSTRLFTTPTTTTLTTGATRRLFPIRTTKKPIFGGKTESSTNRVVTSTGRNEFTVRATENENQETQSWRQIVTTTRRAPTPTGRQNTPFTTLPPTLPTLSRAFERLTTKAARKNLTPAAAIVGSGDTVSVACPHDILIIVDSSGSIQKTYDQQKRFFTEILSQMKVGPNAHRVAMIQFAGARIQKTEFTFDNFNDGREMMDNLNQIRHLTGTTYIGAALSSARHLLETRRRNVPSLVILSSDGYSQDDALAPAERIRQLPNSEFYAVSMSDHSNQKYLAEIVGSTEKVFLNDENRLKELVKRRLSCK
ncbi:unnamed protein product [Bursaphelenchus xylophilus]|uniref:(pine wood nematode) hypothetical protein n=1 Tax=Bursaphelenchus xylophilus TaxID=6326 RepID=A0A1I7SR09_BURXY|nr:unnamed protein product [Bursaphelenchus xylophilus]CAG9110670.1 unnamed protein product [Bursaphelenchus xylophilus]